ncbi:MAG: glycosyl transferase [Gammaproteobacteria bacterium]|nr:glycosyl transferase [Gammaproteobacteria bacterium]
MWLLPPQALTLFGWTLPPAWVLLAVGTLALVWLLNLYNFMDGIDGLAGAQCVTYGVGVSLLAAAPDAGVDFALVLAIAATGFLLWNWSPARIFMGDVGSGYLGLMIGVVALDLAMRGVVPLVGSIILLTPFWFDATYTLCARILSGQSFTAPHRSHAYQKIARRHGHGWTTTINSMVTIVWLGPLAFSAIRWPGLAPVAMGLGALPFALACVRWRAGIPEAAEQ